MQKKPQKNLHISLVQKISIEVWYMVRFKKKRRAKSGLLLYVVM